MYYEEKIEQPTLNTPDIFLFSVTPQKEDNEKNSTTYTVRMYKRKVRMGISRIAHLESLRNLAGGK